MSRRHPFSGQAFWGLNALQQGGLAGGGCHHWPHRPPRPRSPRAWQRQHRAAARARCEAQFSKILAKRRKSRRFRVDLGRCVRILEHCSHLIYRLFVKAARPAGRTGLATRRISRAGLCGQSAGQAGRGGALAPDLSACHFESTREISSARRATAAPPVPPGRDWLAARARGHFSKIPTKQRNCIVSSLASKLFCRSPLGTWCARGWVSKYTWAAGLAEMGRYRIGGARLRHSRHIPPSADGSALLRPAPPPWSRTCTLAFAAILPLAGMATGGGSYGTAGHISPTFQKRDKCFRYHYQKNNVPSVISRMEREKRKIIIGKKIPPA